MNQNVAMKISSIVNYTLILINKFNLTRHFTLKIQNKLIILLWKFTGKSRKISENDNSNLHTF